MRDIGNRIESLDRVLEFSNPMSTSSAQDDDAQGTTASSSSCFVVARQVWTIFLLHVVLVFSSVAIAAVFVVIFPFACMAASLCLICAIMARLLAPPEGAAERGGDSEVAGSGNDGASSREEEENDEGEAELATSCCQECTAAAYADGARFSDPCGDEQEQFFWVDTGNYYGYRKFYDLLAFWRRKERAGSRWKR